MKVVRCPRTVGRVDLLRDLSRRIDEAGSGRGGLVALTGEAGIGKSRVAADAVAHARRVGLAAATGRAVEAGASTPHRALSEALLQALRDRTLPDDPNLSVWLPALATVVPTLPPEADRVWPAVVRGEAVVQLLRWLWPDGGVLVIEDLQWADPDTLEVIEYLAGALDAERVLLCITARADPGANDTRLLERIRRLEGVSVHRVERLNEAELSEMVRCCAVDADDALVRRISRTSEGIPLLVEELLAAPGVPRSLAVTVEDRLGSLSIADRVVVEAAAVLGRSFDWRLLPPITDADDEAVCVALGRAARDLLITVEGSEFRFHHALIREAVLEQLLPSRRAELARRTLEVLDASRPPDDAPALDAWRDLAGDIAAQAGATDRAGRLLIESGWDSLRRGALSTAVNIFERATTVLDAEPELLAEAEKGLVASLAPAGRVDEALAVGRRHLVRAAPGDADAIAMHLTLAQAAVEGTRWSHARTHLHAARQVLGDVDGPDRARLGALEAEVALAAGDASTAEVLADEALANGAADPDTQCRALEVIGRSARLTDLDRARNAFERSLDLAEASQLPMRQLQALHELGTIELFQTCGTGRLGQARRRAVDAGALSTVAVLDLQLAAAHHSRYDLDAGLAHASAAGDLAERLGLTQVRTKALVVLAENHALRRERDRMEVFLALATTAETDDPTTEAFAWGERGTLSFLDDDWDAAARELGAAADLFAALPPAEPANFRGLYPLLLAALDAPHARTALADARAADLERASAHRGFLGYADAIHAGRQGDAARASALAQQADRALSHSGLWRDLAAVCAAAPAKAHGWGSPRAWIAAATPGLQRHGLDALLSRSDRPGSTRADQSVLLRLGITARESDVLALVTDGLSNKEIAAQLQLSPRTVEKHVESLLRKTGARSRTQLAVDMATPAHRT